MNKKQLLNLFNSYAQTVKFIYENKEYEMKVIDEIWFEEMIEKILKK